MSGFGGVGSDGSVIANIGSTNGLALDTTLTSGSEKTIIRGGLKGATSAADVTSTPNGSDHNGIDIIEQFASPAEDNTGTYVGVARYIVSEKGSYLAITDTATHAAIKSGIGVLRRVTVNKAVATGVITIYDALTATGTPIAIITMPATLLQSHFVFEYGVKFSIGLTVVTSVAAQNMTVVYE